MKRDPLALAVFGTALAVLAGLLLYVIFFKTPEPAQPSRAFDFLKDLFQEKTAKKAPPAPPPAAARGAPGAPATLEAGRTWRYAVVVEPPIWRDITLTYRSQKASGGVGVLTDFVHAGGKMNFHLGTFAAWHPSHANVRFPGFFLYPSYFRLPLEPGQEMFWSWPWQPAGNGRMKRYVAKVLRWEDVKVPAGTFRAAVVEARLFYVEIDPKIGGETVRAEVKETLWYAPQAGQIVKVLRVGRAPDESSGHITAELTALN
jgi:hypothetical protein